MRNGIRLRFAGYVVSGGYGHEYIETPIPVGGGSFTNRGQVTRYQIRLAEPIRAQGFSRVVARLQKEQRSCPGSSGTGTGTGTGTGRTVIRTWRNES